MGWNIKLFIMAASCKFNGCSHQECPLYLCFQTRKGERTLLSHCLLLPRKLLLRTEGPQNRVGPFPPLVLQSYVLVYVGPPSHAQAAQYINRAFADLWCEGSPLPTPALHCTIMCKKTSERSALERSRGGGAGR